MASRHHRPHVAGPTDVRAPFTFSAGARVAFSDTDAQGIVYYGRYAPYFDVARVEFWRHLGFDPHTTRERGDFVMRAFEIEYHAPAKFDDVLEVFIRVAKLGRTSIQFEYAVVLADESDTLLAKSTQTLVNVDIDVHQPLVISDEVRASIESHTIASGT
ncbi:MAG: acyl-CoA thioesterase [Thermoleophilia bacterium]|nr:acyl-CoA thioesterase [Thermoleophilia bacterium]